MLSGPVSLAGKPETWLILPAEYLLLEPYLERMGVERPQILYQFYWLTVFKYDFFLRC